MPVTRFSDSAFAFELGDHVFLVPRRHRWTVETFVVLRQIDRSGWPHYELLAPDGSVWTASQLELSAKCISSLG